MVDKKLSSVVQIDGVDFEVTAKKAEIAEKLTNKLTITVKQGSNSPTTLAEFDGSTAKTAAITIPAIPDDYVTETELDRKGYATENYVNSANAGKQATLVSGTNIKTINGESLLGSGNIAISSGGGTSDVASKIKVVMESTTANATITIKPSDPEGGNLGDIWFKY